jgi:4-amino-4-deoxy-L-arabinose transferase-like glycosyltransferase
MKNKKNRLGKFYLLLVVFGFTLFFLIRTKYHLSALETDTGQYAYGAQEVLRGYFPYKDFHINKPPGILFIYSMTFKFIGESSYNIKLIATLSILITSVFIYLIARKLFQAKYAVLVWVLFLLSMSLPNLQGVNANTEVFMITPLLFSLWLLIKGESKKGVLVSGFLVGVATLIKQTALANYLASILWLFLLRRKEFVKSSTIFSLGYLIPLILTLGYLVKIGVWNEFWFSNFIFNKAYISLRPIWIRWLIFPYRIFLENLFLWIFGSIGVINLVRLKKESTSYRSRIYFLLLINFSFTFLFIQLTGQGFSHYYIHLTPLLSFFSIAGLIFMFKKCKKLFVYSLILLFLTTSFFYLYKAVISVGAEKLNESTRFRERGAWYDQSIQVADYISNFTEPGDYIYNLGREGQIYFYTKTRSPSRFMNDRVFLYFPDTLKEACEDLSQNKPKLIVNTLRAPYFSEEWGKYLWNELKKCGDLEIERNEQVYFAEVWFLK